MVAAEPLEGRFHPFIDRLQVALSVGAAVGVFETPESERPFTHREVQHRVRAATGFVPPPVTAGSVCRAGVSGGFLTTYDGVRFSISEGGDAFCAEIHHWSDQALRLYARHIERILPRYARRFPAGQLRHEADLTPRLREYREAESLLVGLRRASRLLDPYDPEHARLLDFADQIFDETLTPWGEELVASDLGIPALRRLYQAMRLAAPGPLPEWPPPLPALEIEEDDST